MTFGGNFASRCALVAALTWGTASLGFGQATCQSATAVPVSIRAEGKTELLADLKITCTTGASSSTAGTATVQIFLSPALPVTSKILSNTTRATEATAITPAGSATGTTSGSSVIFSQIPVPALLPNSSYDITVTNIRADASALNFSDGYSTISMVAFVSGSAVVPTATSTVPIGSVLSGLLATGSAGVFPACSSVTPAAGPFLVARLSEGFASAFKLRGGSGNSTPGAAFTANTETGYFVILGAVNNQATASSRVRVLFNNLPAGGTVFVPLVLTAAGLNPTTLTLTATETGTFSAIAASNQAGLPASPQLGALTVTNGAAEAVYEVTAQNAATIDAFTVPAYLSATSASIAVLAGPITAVVGFVPVGAANNVPNFAAGTVTFAATPITACTPGTIFPAVLPSAAQGGPYFQPLISDSANNWSVSAGTLPAGLALDAVNGILSGTPAVNGSFSFTIKAVDAANNQAVRTFTLQINPALAITTTSLPAGTQGTVYTQTLNASGGIGPYTWGFVDGGLSILGASFVTATGQVTPSGFQTTGQLKARLASPGTQTGTVRVTDSAGNAAFQTLTLQINAANSFCSQASSLTVLARAESTRELSGDLTFSCTGAGGTVDVQLAMAAGNTSVPLTSKVLNIASGATEATLTTSTGTTQGILSSGGSLLTFPSVVIPPGSVSVGISNVRVDATVTAPGLGIPPSISAYLALGNIPNSIEGFGVITAFSQYGLASWNVTGAKAFTACQVLSASAGPAFTVNVPENFASAFKARGDSVSNASRDLETAHFVTIAGVNNQANSGTRFRVLIKNVPGGLSVYMPTVLTSTSAFGGAAMATLTASETGPFAAVSAVVPSGANTLPAAPGLGQVPVVNGVGQGVYEITTADASNLDTFNVAIYFAGAGAAASITASVDLAPVGAASNIPSFGVTNTPVAATAIFSCATPFISSANLPSATSGIAYSTTLTVTGGTPPYKSWTVSTGSLPSGLTLNVATGVISGTPTAAAGSPYRFSVTVNDNAANTSPAQSLVLAVSPAVTSTVLTVPTNPSIYGQPLTLTATVTPAGVTGVVTFYDGVSLLGSAAVIGGQATLTTRPANVGLRILRARFRGNANYAGSGSAPVQETIRTLPASGFTTGFSSFSGTDNQAVAVGDFNGDGILDAVVTNYSDPNGLAVFLGNGDGTFKPAVRQAASATRVKVGDFDGDGRDDVALATPGGQVSILLSKGDGTFRFGGYVDSPGIKAFALADLNLDGKLDLAFTDASASVRVALGNGDGTFGTLTAWPGGSSGVLAIGDFNGDGNPDLVTSGSPGFNFIPGNGDGTFGAPVSVGTGTFADVTVGDWNADGKADLAFADANAPTVTLVLGNGNGTFAAPTSAMLGSYNRPLLLADLDGDGKADLAAPGGYLPGNGDGTFLAVRSLAALQYSFSIALGDVNGDGRQDVIGLGFNGSQVLQIVPGVPANLLPVVSCVPGAGPRFTGTAFTITCSASGGVAPYSWFLSAGNLPAGMTLDAITGLISGTLASGGQYSFTIKATDANIPGQNGTQYVTFNVVTPLTLAPAVLPQGVNGVPYSPTLLAHDGTAPYSCSITTGALPAGMNLNAGTCVLSGTPAAVGQNTFTLSLTDSGNPTQAATRSYSLAIAGLAQSITFAAPANVSFGSSLTLTATATSGLAVSFASNSLLVCTLSGSTVTLLSAGACLITATQPGDATFAAATPVTRSFTITPASQTIVFTQPANAVLGSGAVTLTATASSGLSVTFASTLPTVCTVSNSTVTQVSVGSCAITASQPGNAGYAAATSVTQAFFVLAPANLVTIAVGSGAGITGRTVELPVAIGATGTAAPAGFQLNLGFDASKLSFVSARAGEQSAAAGKGVVSSTPQNGQIRLVLAGVNQNAIAAGIGVYASFQLTAGFTSGASAITTANCSSTDIPGNSLVTSCTGGSIKYASCDINGDGSTNVSDVQIIINEALGVVPSAHDLNGDGAVNVADVQIVINAVLGLGCNAR